MNKLFSILIVTVFFLVIFLPLGGAIIGEDKGISTKEKRKLTQFPEFPTKTSEFKPFVKSFEDYYNDQFGFRTFFLDSYKTVKKMIGDHEITSSSKNIGTKNVIKGKKGWYFLNRKWDGDPVSDYRNIDLYSEGELLRTTLLFAARHDWLKRRNIEYIFFFAPNKHTVYEEYLPDYIKKEGNLSSMDQLKDALSRYSDVHLVDLRRTLIEGKGEASKYWPAKKVESRIYFKKDSHWNGAGVDIAQYEIAKKIERLFPGRIKPQKRKKSDFVFYSFVGDITQIMGGNDPEAFGPRIPKALCTPFTTKDYLKRTHKTYCQHGELNVVVYHDSFLPIMKPYFTDYFKHTFFRWKRLDRYEVEKLRKKHKIDLVIEQRAERHLPFTPGRIDEDYSSFWQKHWPKWRKSVYRLDLKKIAAGKYQSSNVVIGRKKKNGVKLRATSDDPMIHLSGINMKKERLYLMEVNIRSDVKTTLQLYYQVGDKGPFAPSEKYSVKTQLKKGNNKVYLPLFTLNMGKGMRFDFASKEGTYILRSMTIKELDYINLKKI